MPSGVVNSKKNAYLQRQLASQVIRKISIWDALLVLLITSYTMYLQCNSAVAKVNLFATPTNRRQYFAAPKAHYFRLIGDGSSTLLQRPCLLRKMDLSCDTPKRDANTFCHATFGDGFATRRKRCSTTFFWLLVTTLSVAKGSFSFVVNTSASKGYWQSRSMGVKAMVCNLDGWRSRLSISLLS